MRSLRWLLLVVIALVAAGVFQVYRVARQSQKAHQRPLPPSMAKDDRSTALNGWEWGQSANGKPSVYVEAGEMRQSSDGKTFHLRNIALRIYAPSGKFYDRVHTDYGDFDNDTIN